MEDLYFAFKTIENKSHDLESESRLSNLSHEFWRILEFNITVRFIEMIFCCGLFNSGMDKDFFPTRNFDLWGDIKNKF